MQTGERIDPDEVVGLLREARRLVTSGGTDAERHAYSMRKEELLDRITDEQIRWQGGEPR